MNRIDPVNPDRDYLLKICNEIPNYEGIVSSLEGIASLLFYMANEHKDTLDGKALSYLHGELQFISDEIFSLFYRAIDLSSVVENAVKNGEKE